MDDAIIAKATGTAYTGASGATSTTLPAGQQMRGAGGANLTIAKLIEAKKILDLNSVDPSIPRHIVVSPDQIESLLGTTQITHVQQTSTQSEL